ncbi:MAG TPA: M23 family metallopeptidase [Micromonosporaceae bacterium]|nr:M23 family metallopeptidase [Micromonosporaceae bacterium]
MKRARVIALAVCLTGSATLLCVGGTATVSLMSAFGVVPPAAQAAGCGAPEPVVSAPAPASPVKGFTDAQVRNATAIVQAGQSMGVPPRGWVVAVATAMQESTLKNYANDNAAYPEVRRLSLAIPHEAVGHDHDSVGLFQQRPVEGDGGWGTVSELMTPSVSAKKFFDALLKVSNWQGLPVTLAAQRVQRSAFPGAYAKHESAAAALVGAITGGADKVAAAAPVAGVCAEPDVVTAGGWVRPVVAKPGSGFRTASRPTHQGVDLMVSRSTPIKAASAGSVIRMRCNAVHAGSGGEWGCDRDGHPTLVRGCGWYVDIAHADNIVTRYCHMVRQPDVNVGQKVAAGQQIGLAGTSGHSSGVHLHFEVHLRGDTSSAGAVDPVQFMRDHGAALGG